MRWPAETDANTLADAVCAAFVREDELVRSHAVPAPVRVSQQLHTEPVALVIANTFPTIETSMSQLETWSRCDRRYMYRHIRGLVPKGTNEAMQWGTLFHKAAQAYYTALKAGKDQAQGCWEANNAIQTIVEVKNEFHGDSTITLNAEQREQMGDTWDYYYERTASRDDWDEILLVEEPMYLTIMFDGNTVLKIRMTLDVLARQRGRLTILDHKTTGDIDQDLDFLFLDFQVRSYPLGVLAVYGEEPVLCYNMVNREVPPGVGHRSLLTETGNKRSAETLAKMQNPARYLRREWISFTQDQHVAFQKELVQTALMLNFEGNTGMWPRRRVKMGPMSCTTCPYFAICAAEQDGRVMHEDNPLITMAFTIDPKVTPPPQKSGLISPFTGQPF